MSRRAIAKRTSAGGFSGTTGSVIGVADMRQIATVLVFSVGALLSLGMVMLYSASMSEEGMKMLLKQATWLAIGTIGGISAAVLDYRVLRRYAWHLLAVSVVLLALVLIPVVGHKIGGARRWFKLPGVSLQPSEFAKLAMLVWVAFYAEWQTRNIKTFRHGVAFPWLALGLPLGLILVEPDRGTFILMSAVCAGVLFVGGVRWLYLALPAIIGVVGIGWLLWVDPVRMARIMSWLNPEDYKTTTGYQNWQAMIAIGSGGLYGVGLGDGRQKLGFIPEHHTDFIFSIIGEEMGLIATLGVLVAFFLIATCGMMIAWKARDRFGYYLATGITLLISTQAFINIGVVTAALPNKGMSLPFISYGGSSLVAMLGCVGLLISIARRATDDLVIVDEEGADTVFMAAADLK
ncbi:MAG: putative lipid II flippase FtsW [Verrucomicrobiae bacterium]|jgi:cell division protein FtsW|nr:putative lipid II flippase FtsW [Verrucomicrobiae bacterium]